MEIDRRRALAAGGALLSTLAMPGIARAQGGPIRIGSTLPLTGPLASLAIIHKVTADIYVENLNKRGGLLGRQVEWIVRDDQSKPELTRTIYEQLITADKVDLIQSPYATASILAAMGVAQRYNKLLLHTSFGIPKLAKYDMQFQTAGGPFDPENVWPNHIFDAAAKLPKPPKTVAIVTSKFPSVHYISGGARDVLKKRGLQLVLDIEYEFGNRDFGPIASRVKDANPDFLWGGTNGIDPVLMLEAMKRIDYRPPSQVHLFPAPGPMLKMPEAQGSLALTTFESHPPFTDDPQIAQFVQTYAERAKEAGIPYTSVDLQSAIMYAAWQVLETVVNATKSLDDKTLAAWLKKNQVKTLFGTLRWDGPQNYVEGSDLYKVKQLQQGRWVVIHPEQWAAPGVKPV
ncbi:MAG: amino acid ABC transporter substrate-binding protein [Betaproteobacteria bacterium]|nr:amino acid ABC transporter substrate-binding protein [Betaproteobacteria bacterium]